MSEIKINFNKAVTLQVLSRKPCTVKELCNELACSGVEASISTFHRVISQLIEENLITHSEVITTAGRGRESIRYEITEDGIQEIGKIRAAIAAVFMGPF